MSTKVLVFESDSALAGEFRNEFGKLGCAVRVVDDGNVGLQQAQAERPDLILLSIELPRMNGFSVCNKLKKDPSLRDIPLIIMSSESSDETFEQHKKLRTRAEAYVHKPIAFRDLLGEIRPFVALEAEPGASPDNEADAVDLGDANGIVIDDDDGMVPVSEAEVEEAPDSGRTAMYAVPTMPKLARPIDPDIDAFADDAFGRLQDLGATTAAPPVAKADSPQLLDESRTVAPPDNTPEEVAPPRETGRPPANGAEREIPASGRGAEGAHALDEARWKAAQLERQLALAKEEIVRIRQDADAETERLRHDLEEIRSRPAPTPSITPGRGSVPPKGGGVSSREFLDLRETLSKKDKEILALRQQLSAKDKEIFEVRERFLVHEARASELDDRVLAKDRELAEVGERLEEVGARLDVTSKTLTDTQAEAHRLDQELTSLRATREKETAAHDATVADLKRDAEEEAQKAEQAHQDAIRDRDASHANDLSAAKQARESTEAELRRDHAAALAKLGAEKDAEAEQSKKAAVAAREAELEAEVTANVATMREEHEATLGEARSAADAALAEARDAAEAALAETRTSADAKAEALMAELGRAQENVRAHETQVADLLKGKSSLESALASMTVAHGSVTKELEELSTAKESLDQEHQELTTAHSELEAQLREVSSGRASALSDLTKASERGDRLEGDLTAVRGELEAARLELSREASRVTKAHAKWEADKASLERAKDALAVALAQLDEAEARPISD